QPSQDLVPAVAEEAVGRCQHPACQSHFPRTCPRGLHSSKGSLLGSLELQEQSRHRPPRPAPAGGLPWQQRLHPASAFPSPGAQAPAVPPGHQTGPQHSRGLTEPRLPEVQAGGGGWGIRPSPFQLFFRTGQGCPRTVRASGEVGEGSLGPAPVAPHLGQTPREAECAGGAGPATSWAPWGCGETPRWPLRDGSAAGAASRDLGTSASGTASPGTASPGSAAAAPWAGAGALLRGPDPTPPGRLRSARSPGWHAGAAGPGSVRASADCAGLPGSSSVHLEGGRLPDVAGGDAQQQEAGEAGGGQQQRRQQRQRLPGHGCAGGPGVHGAAAGSREAERGRGTVGLAPGAGSGQRRPRPRRDGPPTSSPPRAQGTVPVKPQHAVLAQAGSACPGGAMRLPPHGCCHPPRLPAGPAAPDPAPGLLHRLLSAGERRASLSGGGGGGGGREPGRGPTGQAAYCPVPQAHPSRLQILVAVVQYRTRLREPRRGLCSSWLASLDPVQGPVRVPLWVRSGGLTFPKTPDVPVIMVGPGTGVAPFRAVIQERVAQGETGNVLFFGCRRRDQDFYWEAEWEQLQARGCLTLVTAFSREQEQKLYVQHRLRALGPLVWELLDGRGAHFYLAGNAKYMPADVCDTLLSIFREEGGLSGPDATAYLAQLQRTRRFQTETWA
uniref:Oxidoreductase FAD/NAD(P)-binding domain-containing protein n=1 Tax=Capra hircus TaxID=9925 RepID=A0A8C2SIY7_CAPHI